MNLQSKTLLLVFLVLIPAVSCVSYWRLKQSLDDWIYYSKSLYLLIPTKVTFKIAVSTCNAVNSEVLFLENIAEHDFIIQTFINPTNQSMWLAIIDWNGTEVNVNYYTGAALTFTKYGVYEPNGLKELCWRMARDFYYPSSDWGDQMCNKTYYVLCEKHVENFNLKFEKTAATNPILTVYSAFKVKSKLQCESFCSRDHPMCLEFEYDEVKNGCFLRR